MDKDLNVVGAPAQGRVHDTPAAAQPATNVPAQPAAPSGKPVSSPGPSTGSLVGGRAGVATGSGEVTSLTHGEKAALRDYIREEHTNFPGSAEAKSAAMEARYKGLENNPEAARAYMNNRQSLSKKFGPADRQPHKEPSNPPKQTVAEKIKAQQQAQTGKPASAAAGANKPPDLSQVADERIRSHIREMRAALGEDPNAPIPADREGRNAEFTRLKAQQMEGGARANWKQPEELRPSAKPATGPAPVAEPHTQVGTPPPAETKADEHRPAVQSEPVRPSAESAAIEARRAMIEKSGTPVQKATLARLDPAGQQRYVVTLLAAEAGAPGSPMRTAAENQLRGFEAQPAAGAKPSGSSQQGQVVQANQGNGQGQINQAQGGGAQRHNVPPPRPNVANSIPATTPFESPRSPGAIPTGSLQAAQRDLNRIFANNPVPSSGGAVPTIPPSLPAAAPARVAPTPPPIPAAAMATRPVAPAAPSVPAGEVTSFGQVAPFRPVVPAAPVAPAQAGRIATPPSTAAAPRVPTPRGGAMPKVAAAGILTGIMILAGTVEAAKRAPEGEKTKAVMGNLALGAANLHPVVAATSTAQMYATAYSEGTSGSYELYVKSLENQRRHGIKTPPTMSRAEFIGKGMLRSLTNVTGQAADMVYNLIAPDSKREE